jgi:uncharacterized protein
MSAATAPTPPPLMPLGPALEARDVFRVFGLVVVVMLAVVPLLRAFAAPDLSGSSLRNLWIAQNAIWAAAQMGAIWLLLIRGRNRSWASFDFVPVAPRWGGIAILAALGALPLALLLHALLQQGEGAGTSAVYRRVFAADISGLEAGTLLLYMGYIVPLAEEFLFRGVLFAWLRRRYAFGPAAAVSAAVFAAAHLRLDMMPIAFLMGLAFAWIYERSRSLLAPIMMHQTYNTTALVLTLASAWLAEDAPPPGPT